ncbi:hypothetical protein CesoFtcFv8_006776 [Champsocephalus esox]|uniref:Uncharacterized protein n=1 Tax=Champsocephalus esox TaxID=159716 RepID=A0AAN8CJH2_9TELE|nr:hypothetical protein CesoFtcFv8_006776 [Champsocephalus esox]
MLIFLSSITSGEEEEEEEEGEVVSGGNGDLDGYHHQPPPARILSTDSISRPAVTAAGTQRPFYSSKHCICTVETPGVLLKLARQTASSCYKD